MNDQWNLPDSRLRSFGQIVARIESLDRQIRGMELKWEAIWHRQSAVLIKEKLRKLQERKRKLQEKLNGNERSLGNVSN
jgi:hypothetical protein